MRDCSSTCCGFVINISILL
uniref:Uncharacterized protein n=1 Tax=Rhizophora mucronata TaxID=61149 RepID=A0A2P2PIG7_RHIMU